MTECQAPELQDLLPDYVAELLGDAERSQVHAHLVTCSACAGDVALLRTVRGLRPQAVALDAARLSRIVAALPKPPQQPVTAHPPRPMLVRTVDEKPGTDRATAPVATPPSIHTRPRRRMPSGPTLWRIAATMTVMVAGATSLLVARRGAESGTAPMSQLAAAESLQMPALLAESLSAVQGTDARGVLASQPDVPVSYGDLGDYTEEELQAMLDRLDQWDGATSTDPMPAVPIVGTRGGAL
ncbi:MAG TPA: zf-HC2 domain-containing protein [Gemmatimonas sp.]|uniref:zf-HC2 domain-containing protein n=1 Tax=Gemmatimonas sp. TaxID=1962908 RepID=UPI002EDB7FEB